MKLFLLAGEPSGDLHGSRLAEAFYSLNPDIELVGWGGGLMQDQGVKITRQLDKLSFMGFGEVAKNIFTISENFKLIKQYLSTHPIDALILIDYPGFNLRLAKWAKKKGIRVFYFISPTVWAWKESRVEQIRKYVDRLYCILPFEQSFYADRGVDVTYIGNPLKENVLAFQQKHQREEPELPYIAILPGSRMQEIERIFPMMVEVMAHMKDWHFKIAGSANINPEVYHSFLSKHGLDQTERVSLEFQMTYHILLNAQAAVVTSGTATLETALFNVPQVVCYKTSPINYAIAKRLVNIKFISLVNLIGGQLVVDELIQQQCNSSNIEKSLNQILINNEVRANILANYQKINSKLGVPGISNRLAKDIMGRLSKN